MPIAFARRLTARSRSPEADRHLGYALAFIAGGINAGAFVAVQQAHLAHDRRRSLAVQRRGIRRPSPTMRARGARQHAAPIERLAARCAVHPLAPPGVEQERPLQRRLSSSAAASSFKAPGMFGGIVGIR